MCAIFEAMCNMSVHSITWYFTQGQVKVRCMSNLKLSFNTLQGIPGSLVHATFCLVHCLPRVRFSHCKLSVITMQDGASVGEILFSTRLSVHPSHLSNSSFIRAKQQDGGAHLELIVGLPLLTNPAYCWRNKEINNQGLEKGKNWRV